MAAAAMAIAVAVAMAAARSHKEEDITGRPGLQGLHPRRPLDTGETVRRMWLRKLFPVRRNGSTMPLNALQP